MGAVLQSVRRELATRRLAGAPFDVAWASALPAAIPAPDHDGWLDVLAETRDAWRTAYDRAPATPAERALHAAQVDPYREREAAGEPDPWERICATCSGPIPPTRDVRARFCSRTCQRAAHGRRAPA